MAVSSMKELLEAGVHFGHHTRKWNPKSERYIDGARNNIYIIECYKTLKKREEAYEQIRQMAFNGNTFLFYWPTKPPSLGVGVLVDDMLVVAYGSNPAKLPGVVGYKITAADTLDGIWATIGVQKTGDGSFNIAPPKKAGTETLKRRP